jgi:acetoin utilization deacetylase AcuC-like enzyme/GNAT superfamily N-acetyltransferase
MAIRFIQLSDSDREPRRIAEVQQIFRSYYGEVYGEYADRIPVLLGQRNERQRAMLITAEEPGGRVLAFAFAFYFTDINLVLLDFLVVDRSVRQRGVGGALYDVLRDSLKGLGARGLFFEVRPDAPDLEPNPQYRRENRARIRFYERFGARVIAGTDYEKKRPGNSVGEPYLMFDSLGEERRPSAAEVRDMMRAVLFRKYGYAEDDAHATSIIASVRDDPVALQSPRGQTPPSRIPAIRTLLRPLKVLVTSRHEIHHVRERGYVERPVRVRRIVEAIRKQPGIEIADVSEHRDQAILGVHDPDYVRYLERVCSMLEEQQAVYPYVFPLRLRDRKPVDEEVQAGYYCIDTFTPLTRNVYAAARASADCALSGVDLLCRGEQLVYAICRPPGHHAETRVYGGFCYFNNAAIAANTLSAHGSVAVLDIDFHHGNGTQEIFYDRMDVLVVSIHGDPSYAYPYFAGFADERGSGSGNGYNHNFPLPENIGDQEYLRVLANALEVVASFRPRYLVVSVGLDIAKGDPTGAWTITDRGFELIGAAIARLGLPILAVQEGGYDTRMLGRNARYFLMGLQSSAGL